MQTEKILLTVSIAAAAALSRFRLVDFTGNVPAAGERALGVANADYAAGEQAGVATHGELLVEAGGAVAVGAQVESDASGRAVALSTGAAFGTARDAASGAGELIRVLR